MNIGSQHEIIKYNRKVKQGLKDNVNIFAVDGLWGYEKLDNTSVNIEHYIYCEDYKTTQLNENIIKNSINRSINSYTISRKLMNRLSHKTSKCDMISICSHKSQNEISGTFNKLVVLESLESPGNIGTIFRTANGTSHDAVLIVNENAKVNQYKVIKASMGACFNIPWYSFDSVSKCKDFLNTNNFTICLADPYSKLQYL